MDDVKVMPAESTPPPPAAKAPSVPGGSGADNLRSAAPATGAGKQRRPSRTPQQTRRILLWLSALLMVVLPTSLAGTYFGLIAAPQYATDIRFTVRGPDGGGGSSDLLGMFVGATGAVSTIADSYILIDYLRSRTFLEKLKAKINLERVFNSDKADYLSGFSVKGNSMEEFVKYWRKMLHIEFDAGSKIVSLEIRTFDPKDTMALGKLLLSMSEELVNTLSDRARRDALRMAQVEVSRMEERLRQQLGAMRKFRERHQNIDPARSAAAQIGRLSEIEAQLNAAKAQLAAQSSFMNKSAPSVVYTRAKIKALEEQAAAERAKSGSGDGKPSSGKRDSSLSGLVEDYQALSMELEFAQKAYLSAQAVLERARVNAVQQQRYLATFVEPGLPQEAVYPKRVLNTLIFAFFAVCLWCITVLTYYAVRDHMT